jgi:GNAT superfamily N-acetyltransferase
VKSTQENVQASSISLCPAGLNHEEFLMKVFIDTRKDLSYICGVNEEQKAAIIAEQFRMEQKQMLQIYPEAVLNIVMLNNEPIGRLFVHHGVCTDRILEIGLLERFRNMGIGGILVCSIIENAVKQNKTVSLQVAWFNQGALAFYERLGFKITKSNGVIYEMVFIP